MRRSFCSPKRDLTKLTNCLKASVLFNKAQYSIVSFPNVMITWLCGRASLVKLPSEKKPFPMDFPIDYIKVCDSTRILRYGALSLQVAYSKLPISRPKY